SPVIVAMSSIPLVDAARSHTAPSNDDVAVHPVRATRARLNVARAADVLRTRSSLLRTLLIVARRGGRYRTFSRPSRFAHTLSEVLVGDLTVADSAGRPLLQIFVAVTRLRCTALDLR